MKKTQKNHDVAEFASELHWQAFCYVAEEMTAEQTIQFEQRLAEDFEAQIAVADAVSLSSSTYASIETLKRGDVSVERRQAAGTNHRTDPSFSWRWVAAVAAGFLVIVSSWQLLHNLQDNHEVVVNSTASNGQVTKSAIGLNELELWDRTVEIFHLANVSDVESETDSNSIASESFDGDYGADYVNAEGDSGEIVDALFVDSDLASLFASGISSLDLSKGEL